MTFSKRAFVALAVVVASPSALAEPKGAWVASIKGDTQINGHPAKNGEKLAPGAKIKTGDGTASIFLAGQALIRVGKHTETTLNKLSAPSGDAIDTEIELKQGKVRALLRDGSPKRMLRIRTKTATMGVSGSHALGSQEPDSPPDFTVVEGHADVTYGDQVIPLTALQKYKAGDGAPTNVTAKEAQSAVEAIAPTTSEEQKVSSGGGSSETKSEETKSDSEAEKKDETAAEEKTTESKTDSGCVFCQLPVAPTLDPKSLPSSSKVKATFTF